MNIRSLLFFLIFSLLLAPALASDLQSYDGTYTIIADKVIVEETVTFSEPITSFEMLIPTDAQALEVKGAKFKSEELENARKITISDPQSGTFTLKYITESLIEKTKDEFFLLDLGQLEAAKITVKLTLPEGATLKYNLDSPKLSIIPKANSIETDGKSIIITWNELNLQQSKALFVIYNEKKSNNLVYGSSIAITFLIVISLALYLLSRKKTEKQRRVIPPENDALGEESEFPEKVKENLTRNLFEEERAIMETLLKAKDHELWQKQVALETGISKVKLSRKVRNLEAKGLIEKIPFGNTNKIRIKKQ